MCHTLWGHWLWRCYKGFTFYFNNSVPIAKICATPKCSTLSGDIDNQYIDVKNNERPDHTEIKSIQEINEKVDDRISRLEIIKSNLRANGSIYHNDTADYKENQSINGCLNNKNPEQSSHMTLNKKQNLIITWDYLIKNKGIFHSIDIRRKEDFNRISYKESKNVPEITKENFKFDLLKQIGKKIAVSCYHGNSSREAVENLRKHDVDAYSVEGGFGCFPIEEFKGEVVRHA